MLKFVISIIVPVYNEEKIIGKFLESYGNFFTNKKIKREIDNFELLISINNTSDNTEEIVKKFCEKYKEIKYINSKEKGKGLAIIKGFKEALNTSSDMIGFVDADMSTSPEAFYDLIKDMKNKYIDGIIANRWDKRSVIQKQTLLRQIVSRGYNIIVKTFFLLPYKDTQCGAKVFRRNVLEKNIDKLVTSDWGFDVALLYCIRKESHARIISVPTVWNDRRESKINLRRTPIVMFLSLVRLRLIHSPFKFLVRFYRKLPQKWKFH